LSFATHLSTVAKIFKYRDETDAQAVELQKRLATDDLTDVIKSVTGLEDIKLVTAIKKAVEAL